MANGGSVGGRTATWVLRAIAWLTTAALALADVYMIREAVSASYLFFRLGKYGFALADKLLILVLGFVWLVAVLYAQHLYALYSETDVSLQRLWVRFFRFTAAEVTIAFGGTVIIALVR